MAGRKARRFGAVTVHHNVASGLPAKVWGLWVNSFQLPYIRNIPADVQNTATHLILGIAQSAASGTGNLTYGVYNGQSQANHVADLAAFKVGGKHVLMGIGGSSDGGITITNSTQVTQAYNSIVGFVNTFGITGIDIDLEPSGSSWNQTSLVSLISQLKATYGSGFVVGVTPGLYSPYTATWLALAGALGSNMDYMAPMLYDFPEAGDSRESAVAVSKCDAMAGGGIPASKMVMGFMARQNASYPNSSPPQVMKDAYDAALAAYPTLRGAFVWEATIEDEQNYTATRLTGQAINTATSTGVLVNEPFTTNSTGSTPQHLVLGATPTGGGVTISSNQADFATGTAGGYAAGAVVSRRFSTDGTNALSVADIAVQFAFTPGTGESYPEVVVRCNQAVWDGNTGYWLRLNSGVLAITKSVAYTDTVLATTSFTYTPNTQYQVKFSVVGTSLQAWIGTTLPGSPTLSTTDGAITAAGFAAFKVGPGAAASSSHVLLDNLLVTNN